MKRRADIERKTKETQIQLSLGLDGSGVCKCETGIGFLDHMLNLFSAHGFFDLTVSAKGDLDVDFHHTVEDVGLVLGTAINDALGNRTGTNRYGFAVTPMDETLAQVAIDLSKRPYLVYRVPDGISGKREFDLGLAKEFFQAVVVRGGMNLHINVPYGDNEHHVIEAVFKAFGRALDEAVAPNKRIKGARSTKGVL